MVKPKLYVTSAKDIKSGKLTDIYFSRSVEVLNRKGLATRVVSDVHTYSLSKSYDWAVLAGIEEVAYTLEGVDVDVYAMDEGTLFHAYEPVLSIDGLYGEFGVYEPSILGLLRHSSGVATQAARCRKAAGEKPIIFFGIRAVHPAITPMVDRAAFIGGCDAVSGTIGAEMIDEKPLGTMPHALIIIYGDQVQAWKAFDEVMDEDIPRIFLCDTWYDERVESVMAAKTIGDRVEAVRLDTPHSRKGDLKKIAIETRWALDTYGHEKVRIYLSGGMNEYRIKELVDIVDGFGVGTSIAQPRSIDLAMDIVEVEGKPISKKGKLPGRKQVYGCRDCFKHTLVLANVEVEKCPSCGGPVDPLLKPLIKGGELVRDMPRAREIRKYTLDQLKKVELKL